LEPPYIPETTNITEMLKIQTKFTEKLDRIKKQSSEQPITASQLDDSEGPFDSNWDEVF
jgi:hypothetical protein